jgi:hypothetical protein
MWLYHWVRYWAAPEHVTMWTEIQAIATILAFGAAACYARIAKRQLDAFLAETRIGHKPIVFTVREDHPEKANDFNYFILNVGKGTAVNVWYADKPSDAGDWRLRSLGALGAGQRRLLVAPFEQPLRDSGGTFRHILAAEGVPARTTRWTLTGNIRGAQQGSNMKGQLLELKNPHLASLKEVLEGEGEALLAQLGSDPVTAD